MDFFPVSIANEARRNQLASKPEPATTYVVYFTARSGSSWLTDVVTKTGALGEPGEWFNPNFVPNIAEALGATDMDSYVHLVKRRFTHGGVFGVEITSHQLKRIFGEYPAFDAYFPGAKSIWLIRRDIVAQAVSLAKMVTTEVSHTAHSDTGAQLAADEKFTYDAEVIQKWLKHLHNGEIQTEAWIGEFNLDPLRICYEDMMAIGAEGAVNVVSNHIGVSPVANMELSSGHAKLGTEKNSSFASQFREDMADFIKEIDEQRHEMLSKLTPIDELRRLAAG